MTEITQEQVNELRKEAEEAYLKYANLKETFTQAEQEWMKKSRRFKDFDYKLALTDGRLKKVPPGGEKKVKKQPELTPEQLKSIAATLGVNITVEEPIEESAEIEEINEEEANGLQNQEA